MMTWLLVLNLGLLGIAAYTDFRYRQVYLQWSGAALLVGLWTAIWPWAYHAAPFPWVRLTLACVLIAANLHTWDRGRHGGGDVWITGYGALLLGPALLWALGLGVLLLLVGVATRRLTWRGRAPVAGLQAVAIGLVLLALWGVPLI